MIKIEALNGTATITREGEKCTVFVGMVLEPGEESSLTTTGEVTYTVDETAPITVTATPVVAAKPTK